MSDFKLSENTLRVVLCLLTLFANIDSGFAGSLGVSSDDAITITAERAWEAEEVGVIHFSGKFKLRAPNWYVSADTAVVYGNLESPDKLILKGKPATIFLLRDADKSNTTPDAEESVEGRASNIEYFRATEKLKMTGAAILIRDDEVLTGEVIEYDVDTDRYSAGGEGGINVQLSPKK